MRNGTVLGSARDPPNPPGGVVRRAAHNRPVPKKRKDDPLEPYRRVRKPMPPPERVERDRRRKALDEQARREADEERER
jgi:hypothetical protein